MEYHNSPSISCDIPFSIGKVDGYFYFMKRSVRIILAVTFIAVSMNHQVKSQSKIWDVVNPHPFMLGIEHESSVLLRYKSNIGVNALYWSESYKKRPNFSIFVFSTGYSTIPALKRNGMYFSAEYQYYVKPKEKIINTTEKAAFPRPRQTIRKFGLCTEVGSVVYSKNMSFQFKAGFVWASAFSISYQTDFYENKFQHGISAKVFINPMLFFHYMHDWVEK
jgi:hypothetical protein